MMHVLMPSIHLENLNRSVGTALRRIENFPSSISGRIEIDEIKPDNIIIYDLSVKPKQIQSIFACGSRVS